MADMRYDFIQYTYFIILCIIYVHLIFICMYLLLDWQRIKFNSIWLQLFIVYIGLPMGSPLWLWSQFFRCADLCRSPGQIQQGCMSQKLKITGRKSQKTIFKVTRSPLKPPEVVSRNIPIGSPRVNTDIPSRFLNIANAIHWHSALIKSMDVLQRLPSLARNFSRKIARRYIVSYQQHYSQVQGDRSIPPTLEKKSHHQHLHRVYIHIVQCTVQTTIKRRDSPSIFSNPHHFALKII